MALPLVPYSGPTVRRMTVQCYNTGQCYVAPGFTKTRSGFKQTKPYDRVTPWNTVMTWNTSGYAPSDIPVSVPNQLDYVLVGATNSCYEKLVGKLGDASQLGSTLTAEARQSYETVVGGLATLVSAANALRKGQILEAARLLRFAPPKRYTRVVTRRFRRAGVYYKKVRTRQVLSLPNGGEVLDNMAGRWLWFSYGVKPIAQDVYNAVDVLQRELPWMPIRVNATLEGSFRHRTSDYYWSQTDWTRSVGCIMRTKVSVSNPNLWLANRLGLINPAQWILEGIPGSFVLDWFSNLSSVISSMTDFAGLSLTDSTTTVKESRTQRDTVWHGDSSSKLTLEYTRSLGIRSPKLRFAYERFQWQRGLNAISLLIGFLPEASKAQFLKR